MQVQEILATTRKFHFKPDEGESSAFFFTATLNYVTPSLTLHTILGDVYMLLGKDGDPGQILSNMSKEDMLICMKCHKKPKYSESSVQTNLKVNSKCKELGIINNIVGETYDEMMKTFGTYSDEYSYRSLCNVIRNHKDLKQYANDIIVLIEEYPDFHSSLADIIIDKLIPILKTTPPLSVGKTMIIQY